MSDLLIAIVGENFVLMGADSSQTRSVLMLKDDEDKIMTLDSHKLLGGSGEQGDRVQFTEYIQKNVALYQLRTGIALSTHAAANFTRRELATALRSNPYSVNLLLAGFDASATDAGNGTASLYFIDYLSSLHKVNFACQGYANYFLLGLLDKHYKKGMSFDEALDLMTLCTNELRTRFVLNTTKFIIKCVDADGVRLVPPNSSSSASTQTGE
eukprot:TRINITY_DN935_c0_g1_i2.p1 TRINITY_DN935_c0_g1~~TRINITY_DN935_c0_g1_i2.p1  ORF type:complete len:231 (+),score=41.35 TRINITY_DN935_c0_g1_i2:59-694(+)